MSIVLYGSMASPYVRRIRILLEGVDHQFKVTNVFDEETRKTFSKVSPVKKLPVLTHGDVTLFDSHVIHQYLQQRGLAELSVQEHNIVSVIDAVTDSLIVLLMGKRSGLDTSEETMIFRLQLERLPDSLDWLNQQAEQGAFDEWHFASIALISLLDWGQFRNLYDFSAYSALLAARDKHLQREIVRVTAPE